MAGAGATSLFGGIAENFSKVTTINASTQTGGVTITGANTAVTGLLGGNTALTSFKGGTGNDSLDISTLTTQAQLAGFTAGNLDGGTGTDTLILRSAAANAATAVLNSNFETLGITGLTGTVNYGAFGAGLTTIALTTPQTGGAIFNNMTSGITFAGGANTAGFAETFNSTGTALTDVINVTWTGTGAGIGAQVFTGFEVINQTITAAAAPAATFIAGIAATPSAGGSVIFNLVDNNGTGTFTVAGVTNLGTAGTLNISGTGTGSVIAGGTITAGAINASGLNTGAAAATVGFTMGAFGTAGAVTILGSAGADTLNGSTAADTISGGAGNDAIMNMLTGNGAGVFDVLTGGTGNDAFIIRGDIAGAGALPAAYSTVTNVTDFTVGGTIATTDFIQLSFTAANYAVFGADLRAAGAAAQGTWALQQITNGSGTVALLSDTAATGATLIKLTTGVAAGATINATWDAAIGTSKITGITKSKSYFFTMFDTTNNRMDVGIVKDSTADTTLKAGDTVGLIASVNMSVADYASITNVHFALAAA